MGRFLSSSLGLVTCALVALMSAIAIVSETHQTRVLFAQLQSLENERWGLQEDYSRLVIEYSTLSSPRRISALSDMRLSMLSPDAAAIQVLVE